MALEYTTKSGDTWDQIAYTVYGSELKADWLMQANPEYIEFTRFDSGLVLSTPALPAEKSGTCRRGKRGYEHGVCNSETQRPSGNDPAEI